MKSAPTFAELVKRCNDFLYGHMYPDGQMEFCRSQHRDLVRTFFAGAFEGMMAIEDRESMEPLICEYEKMAAVNWWPDGRFMPPTP